MKNYNINNLPEEMQKIIGELKQSKNKLDCLHKAYDALTAKHRGYRYATITHFSNLFIKNPNELWDKREKILCTNLNHLLKILLVGSGFFMDKDVKKKWTSVGYTSPHQYLRVKINDNQYINVDVWGKANGIEFGDYAHGFH
ncbi:MAG: hypothetical protein KAR54_00730 [Candidatus Pacebacteria bacterium]|nr:hypothetical protein [Candidatus Paceibacterota bacterium]